MSPQQCSNAKFEILAFSKKKKKTTALSRETQKARHGVFTVKRKCASPSVNMCSENWGENNLQKKIERPMGIARNGGQKRALEGQGRAQEIASRELAHMVRRAGISSESSHMAEVARGAENWPPRGSRRGKPPAPAAGDINVWFPYGSRSPPPFCTW